MKHKTRSMFLRKMDFKNLGKSPLFVFSVIVHDLYSLRGRLRIPTFEFKSANLKST